MKKFRGFPSKTEFTAVPNLFFSGLLPEIDDLAELKTTLHVMARLYRQKGYPRYVGRAELLGDAVLMGGLRANDSRPEEALERGLGLAAERGTLLHVRLENGGTDDIYFLNDAAGRQAVARIESGELKLPGARAAATPPAAAGAPPDIFTLYEQNIGLLTPMIADELKDAESHYPAEWLRDAIREAVNHGKRKWSYIAAILERWSTEGKSDGTYQRDSEKTDPDRYVKGKYGHMVQR